VAKKGDEGERFHKGTRYFRESMEGGGLDWDSQPEPYKEYPDSERVPLPPPKGSTATLEDVLKRRRSVRLYRDRPLDLEQLSYLLWASTGISKEVKGSAYRTAPSAGALYPLETYLVVNDVEGLDKGIYHHNIREHSLELLRKGNFGADAARAALGQAMPRTAPVAFVWTAVFQRSRWKYEQRAYRYIYMDAGHMAENLALAAVSLDLGTVQIGALFDTECDELIGVDGEEEAVIYMSTVGWPK